MENDFTQYVNILLKVVQWQIKGAKLKLSKFSSDVNYNHLRLLLKEMDLVFVFAIDFLEKYELKN